LMDPHLEQLFIEREQLIDSILSVQEQIDNFNARKQLNAAALKSLKSNASCCPSKHWVCAGEFFLKLPHPIITQILEKDQEKIENELNSLSKTSQYKARQLEQLGVLISQSSLVSGLPK